MTTSHLFMILAHTPTWVWGLFIALLALGLSQTRDRWISEARLRRMPWLFVAFSVWSTVQAFGWQLAAVGGFLVAASSTRQLILAGSPAASARHDADRAAWFIPGSWMPLAVMMLIFAVKYTVGAALALVPQLASEPSVVLGVSLLNGALGVVFLARSERVLMSRRVG